MGAYLATPVTAKESSDGRSSGGAIRWGASSMQGWRKTMEDAHVTETDVLGEPDSAVFGVFDGHGGSEVARFCQTHLMGVLAADADFKARAPPTIGCSVRARQLLLAPAPARGSLARAPTDRCVRTQMVRCFHELDSMMRTEAAAAELETYKWREPGEDPGAASGTDKEQVRAAGCLCGSSNALG